MADLQFIVDYTSLKKANQEILQTGSNAQKSAKVFEQAYKKVESSQRKNTAALRKQIAFSERMRKQKERETNAVMKSLDAQRKASQEVINSYRRVKMAADPLYASEVRLKQAQRDVITAYKQGNITRREAIETMRQYRAAVQNGTLAGQGLNKGMNRMGVLFQQTGYQVGDFAVQVQSGTHYMVALGQQATQLVGTFGMLAKSTKMIALFSGLGILVPIVTAFAGAWLRARDNADDSLSRIEEHLKSFRGEVKKAADDVALIGTAFDSIAQKVAFEEIDNLAAQIKEVTSNLEGANQRQLRLTKAGREAEIRALEERRDLLQEEYNQLVTNLRIIEASERAENRRNSYVEEMVQYFRDIRAGYAASVGPAQTLTNTTSEYVTKMAEVFERTQALKEELGDAAYEALRLAGVDLSSGISSAAKEAGLLAGRLGIALNAAVSLANLRSSKTYSGRGGDPRTSNTQGYGSMDAPNIDAIIESFNKGQSRSSGGGGGMSAAEKLTQETDKARQALNNLIGTYDDAQARANQLAKAQETVNKALELGVINGKQADQIMQDYTNSLEKVKGPLEKIAETAKQAFGDAFMSIVDGTKSAKDAFKDMARAILKQAFDLLVVKPLMDSLFGGLTGGSGGGGGFLSGLLGFANGGAFDRGKQLTAFADGGVVSSPTVFPMANGAGLMGEAGPEAIMPLKRGSNGKLGVQMEGNQGNVSVENHFHISANGDDSVKRIIAQEAPKIANLTQRQVLEARARGGAFRNTFGG